MRRPRGRRSSKDVRDPWVCLKGYKNLPEPHEFFDTPLPYVVVDADRRRFRFLSRPCQSQWSQIIRRSHGPRKSRIMCTICLYQTDRANKEGEILAKNKDPDSPTPLVDPFDLDKKYKKMNGNHPRGGLAQVILMTRILKEQGVMNESGTHIYKASNVSVISIKEPARIVAALADGFPLHAGVIHGKKLWQLIYCRPYRSPHLHRAIAKMKEGRLKAIPGHAVLLVGACRKKGRLYFYFMNSWKQFAPHESNRGEVLSEGIGKVAAQSLYRNMIRISHFREEQTSTSLLPQTLPVTVGCHNVGLLVP